MKEVAIIDYGAGNVHSVRYALERLGARVLITADHDRIARASGVIFPGVGHARPAMKNLESTGLTTVIPLLRQPVLGICLGLQLMCAFSEEGGVAGLGIFETEVKRFKEGLKVPHMGWNRLETVAGPLFKGVDPGAWVYFVHSYYAPVLAHTTALTRYGIPFSAAVQRANFYACQFHPEKSGTTGSHILQNFLHLI